MRNTFKKLTYKSPDLIKITMTETEGRINQWKSNSDYSLYIIYLKNFVEDMT